ncbi:MAG TPA: sigma factor [Acidimicrobiales bacterium]
MGTGTAFGVEDFEAAWPEVSRRVLSGLRRRRVGADMAEEALQEAAARAWRARPEVTSVDELARWTYTVALRVVIDRSRRETPLAVLPDTPEQPVCDDAQPGVETTVLARLDLARALRAIRALRPADRAALATVVAAGDVAYGDRREAVRDAVRLHRARARLVLVLGKIFGGGVTGAGARRLRLLAMPAPRAVAPAAGAAAAAAVVVVVIALGGAPDAAPPTALADPAERLSFDPASALVVPEDIGSHTPSVGGPGATDPPPGPGGAPLLPELPGVVVGVPQLPPGLVDNDGEGLGPLPPLDPAPLVQPYVDLVTGLVAPIVDTIPDPGVDPVEPVDPVGPADPADPGIPAGALSVRPAADAIDGEPRPAADRYADLVLG